jgi:uncharacterized coiled-coil DUF342 family protein
MKTSEELIREWGDLSGGTPEQHIYDYFVKREGDIVASYEIDRINLVAMTLERDELDEQYKMVVADRNTCRAMYKETLQERDGWISEYRAAREEVERLKEKLTVYENQWEPSKQEQIDSFSEKFDQLDEEYQDLVRIATCLYKADKEAIREMINEGLGGDNYEKFKNHLGV